MMRYRDSRISWRPVGSLACAAMALVLFCVPKAAPATVFTWDNYYGDGSFQTRYNWTPYPLPTNVPGTGDTAVFNGLLAGSGVGNNTVDVAHGTAINDMQVIDTAIVDLTIGDGTTASRFDLDQTSTSNGLVVGDSSGDTASLNLQGGWLDTYAAWIGGRATFNVVGANSHWDSTHVLISGDTIPETAGIGLGLQAQITSHGNLDIGSDTGSGRVVIEGSGVGPGALWTVNGAVDVGPTSTSGFNFGQLTLQGGRMQAYTLDVHGTSNLDSTVTVKSGGDMSVDGLLQIGPYGKLELLDSSSTVATGDIDKNGGTLNWTGGTLHITDSDLRIDNSTDADLDIASLTVGNGMTLKVTRTQSNPHTLFIGLHATGLLSIENSGIVESYNAYIGTFSGSNGTCIVNGAGSWLDVTEDITIGHQNSGVGRLEILGGGHAEGTSFAIGAIDTADGTVIVDGPDSTLTSTAVLAVGGQITDDGVTPTAGGTGSLNVNNGGSVDIHDTLYVFGDSSLAVSGSTSAIIASHLWLESGASFSNTSGTLVRVNQLTGLGNAVFYGNLQIGHAAGFSGFGSHAVGAGQSLEVKGFLTIGYDAPAEFVIADGGAVDSQQSFIGGMTGSEGTFYVSSEGSSWTCGEDLYVGYDGRGSLVITDGGLISVAGTLTIDSDTDGDSFIYMSTGGMLAIFGEADDSMPQFLGLINGTDAINYWDDSISDWADITGAMRCRDYTLNYLTAGDLSGYTLLTVRRAIDGDANGDGTVDVTDLGILATNYGAGTGFGWCGADFTGDGKVDVSDLGILATHYGETAAATTVPEPGMLALLATCWLMLSGLRARRRKQ